MSSQSEPAAQYPVDSPAAAPAVEAETRPFYWSVRREVWENRSVWIAPLVVAAVVLFASLISTVTLPRKMRNAETLEPARRHVVVVSHFSMVPAPILFTTFLVGLFYSLDALYGERRDRSILFWKSLPVSDRTTVLSKAAVPMVVLPLIGFVIGQITQLIFLLFSTVVLVGSGVGAGRLWAEFRLFQEPLIMLYGLTVFSLWYAPIYGWLMLVSAWARRVPLLWAVLPLLAVAAVERIVFNSMSFMRMLEYRVVGAMREAFAFAPKRNDGLIDQLSQLDPVKFLTRPGLWVGLLFAAACFTAAARLRRLREPI